MSNEFKQQIIDDYTQKNIWYILINMLKNLTERSRRENTKNIPTTNAVTPIILDSIFIASTSTGNNEPDGKRVFKFKTGIDFESNDGLIYFSKSGKRRLFLFLSIKKVFHLTHDKNIHAGIHRGFNRLIDIFYNPRFSKKIRRYIEHCPNCQLIQMKKHRQYGELIFNIFPFQLFHTITIDFVFVLFGELYALFNVTDKFIRKIVFTPGKSIYNVNQWVNALMDHLFIIDWGIPTVIISDRDFIKILIYGKYFSNEWEPNYLFLRHITRKPMGLQNAPTKRWK